MFNNGDHIYLRTSHSALAVELLPLLPLECGRAVALQVLTQSADVTGNITPGISDLMDSFEILRL